MSTCARSGTTLNVANLLEGSVRKAGSQRARYGPLVKASDGYHLWSEYLRSQARRHLCDTTGNRHQGDRSLARDAVGRGRRARQFRSRIAEQIHRPTRSICAACTSGNANRTIGSLNQAREKFEASLAIDDQYAGAHWGLFRVWDRMHRNAHGPFEQSLAQMQHHADELRRLTPNSDRALSAAARYALVAYDFDQAAAYLEDAVETVSGQRGSAG